MSSSCSSSMSMSMRTTTAEPGATEHALLRCRGAESRGAERFTG